MDEINGWVSRIKYKVFDYVYDECDVNLSSKFRCKFKFKFKVE